MWTRLCCFLSPFFMHPERMRSTISHMFHLVFAIGQSALRDVCLRPALLAIILRPSVAGCMCARVCNRALNASSLCENHCPSFLTKCLPKYSEGSQKAAETHFNQVVLESSEGCCVHQSCTAFFNFLLCFLVGLRWYV